MPKAYEFHPIADLFPLMVEAELNELAEDIKVNGLKLPILLYEEKILDGRNRYRACELAKVRPLFHHYKGQDPLKWSLSLNLHRRHLTTAQRAAIAAELANLGQGARTDLALNEARLSQSEAADVMDVSRSSVQRAVAVKAADPEIHQKMKAGEFPSIADAERAASPEVPSPSNGNHSNPAASNVTPFSEEPSRPITEEDKCIQQFKNLIKDLSKEFKTTNSVIRSYLRRYLTDYRR